MTILSEPARSRLSDIVTICNDLGVIVPGRTFEQFRHSTGFRWSIERALELIGEATAQALKLDPNLLTVIPEAREIIGMRNWLIHGYRDIDEEMVWEAATIEAPALATKIREILKENSEP